MEMTIQIPKLHKGQIRLANDPARFKIVVMGRRWGKSTYIMAYASALIAQGKKVAICAPNYKYLKPTFEAITNICKPIVKQANKSTYTITTLTGGTLDCWTLDDKDACSGRRYHHVFIDEAGLKREGLIDIINNAIMPSLIDYNGRMTVIGSPKGKGTDFFTLWEKAEYADSYSRFSLPSYDNPYLTKEAIEAMAAELPESSRLQEIHAQWLEENAFAIIKKSFYKYVDPEDVPELELIVVGVDPAITCNDNSDSTGIIVVGRGVDGNFYVLEDASGKFTPEGFSQQIAHVYKKWDALFVVVETNAGGDFVKSSLQASGFDGYVFEVRATKNKSTRAEPIAVLYEKGKVYHTSHKFTKLEEELTGYSLGGEYSYVGSPDRGDALVWGLTKAAGIGESFAGVM